MPRLPRILVTLTLVGSLFALIIQNNAMKKTLSAIAATLLAVLPSIANQGKMVTPPYDAPEAEGVDQEGKAVKFSDLYKANEFVVVYFYPKADTPGCTKQGCSLRDAHADLTKMGVKVVGVSHDDVGAQKSFSDKFHFPFTLIADKDAKVIQAFKVAQMVAGMATRQCFLIQKGKVVWRDEKASTDKQADDLKAVLAELKK
jgi:peroxiredoxin Q/BCP